MKAFRARWGVVVLLTLVGVGLAYGWTYFQPKVYTSTASSIITAGVSADLGSALAGDNYSKSRVKSYLDIAKSRTVADYASNRLGLSMASDELIGRISVSNPLDTAVIRVSATGATPELARSLAEVWIDGMTAAVTEVETGGDSSAQSIVQLRTLDSATLPTEPSFPNTQLSLAIGGLSGLALGFVLALVLFNQDKRIRSTKALEAQYQLPVIGSIPYSKKSVIGVNEKVDARVAATTKNQGDAQAFNEALRKLRTNLQFMNVDKPPRIIVITSSLPSEGKSVISANLATSLAASGTRVVLIDGDLRRPSLVSKFGLVEGAGLTDVLVGKASATDVLQVVGTTGNLAVMGPGALPPNPSELLGSDTMHNLLRELEKMAIVIIDAPPLLPVTDAVILTARTDGAIVVALAGKTTTDELSNALDNLTRIGGKPLGLVLNAIPLRGSKGEGYGYLYRGNYVSQGSKKSNPAKSRRAAR